MKTIFAVERFRRHNPTRESVLNEKPTIILFLEFLIHQNKIFIYIKKDVILLLTEKQYRAIFAKQNKTKKDHLNLGLYDADRRYEIGISRMSEITKRLQELEIARNLALRKQYLENEIKRNPNPNLIKEYNEIKADDRDIFTYQEVAQGYKSLSRRKNELQEERN